MTSATRNQPISSHPAFRWAVGLWFAALLGGGMIVMPDAVHAGLRQSLGIDDFLPAGVPGKLALSGAAALVGLLLGLVIALRIAALNAVRDEEDSEDSGVWLDDEAAEAGVQQLIEADEEPRRPFNPRDYMAEDGIESWTEGDLVEGAADPAAAAESAFAIEDYLPEAEPVCDEPADCTPVADVADDEEWVPEVVETVEEPATEEPAIEPPADAATLAEDPPALGDLSLADLTARLGRAIEARRMAEVEGAANPDDDVDPVIAFLRREADRAGPARHDAADSDSDPQAALRGALDRLSQVSNPR